MNDFNRTLRAYLQALLSTRWAKLAQARARGDVGASAVELAIITAMILGIALGLLIAIRQFVKTESNSIHG
jgi:hypothetical protein